MDEDNRKAAIAAYRERKVEAGIYAVRCLSTDAIWIGRAPDLSTIQNRLWFTLRLGSNPHRSLQDAWKAQGADAFTFEIVERLDPEEDGHARDRLLKARLVHWAETLDAVTI